MENNIPTRLCVAFNNEGKLVDFRVDDTLMEGEVLYVREDVLCSSIAGLIANIKVLDRKLEKLISGTGESNARAVDVESLFGTDYTASSQDGTDSGMDGFVKQLRQLPIKIMTIQGGQSDASWNEANPGGDGFVKLPEFQNRIQSESPKRG